VNPTGSTVEGSLKKDALGKNDKARDYFTLRKAKRRSIIKTLTKSIYKGVVERLESCATFIGISSWNNTEKSFMSRRRRGHKKGKWGLVGLIRGEDEVSSLPGGQNVGVAGLFTSVEKESILQANAVGRGTNPRRVRKCFLEYRSSLTKKATSRMKMRGAKRVTTSTQGRRVTHAGRQKKCLGGEPC